MPDAPEMSCPLCGAPRRDRAGRLRSKCICNYTFAYDTRGQASGGAVSLQLRSMVPVVAIIAAFMTGWLASGIDPAENTRPEIGFLLAPAGAFCVAGAWFGWRWFFSMGKARLIVAMFGATGARMFYALLGGALFGGGLGLLLV